MCVRLIDFLFLFLSRLLPTLIIPVLSSSFGLLFSLRSISVIDKTIYTSILRTKSDPERLEGYPNLNDSIPADIEPAATVTPLSTQVLSITQGS